MDDSPHSILFVTGDATHPQGDGPKIIVHICNDRGGWGRGFVVALSRRWRQPEETYRTWYTGRATNDFALGAVQFVDVEPDIQVANLVGQHSYRRENGIPPIRYDAVRQGLETVAAQARETGASVHMPRIGCGLAGGDWSVISRIVEETLIGQRIAVTVYDLPEQHADEG